MPAHRSAGLQKNSPANVKQEAPEPTQRIRYAPAPGPAAGSRPAFRLLSYASAPLGGSRFLFPRRLAAILDDERRDTACRSIARIHARWYFGDSLILWTDPRRLTRRLHDRVRAGAAEVQLGDRFVDMEDWTDVISPIAELPEHRETTELVEWGRAYPNMPTFKAMLRRLEKQRPMHRYGMRLDSEEKLHSYFRYFLDLIDSIRTNGFREQSSLRGIGVPVGLAVRGKFALRQRNIGAAIDENGSLLRFLGGRHRTAIAQALTLPAFPVEIRLVHAGWLVEEARRSRLSPADALRGWVAQHSRRDT